MERIRSLGWYQKGILILLAAMSLLFTVLFFRRVYRQKIRPLPEDGGNSTGQEAARFAASRAAER